MNFTQALNEAVNEALRLVKAGIDPEEDRKWDDSLFTENPFTIVKPFTCRYSQYCLRVKGKDHSVVFYLNKNMGEDEADCLYIFDTADFNFHCAPNYTKNILSKAFKEIP